MLNYKSKKGANMKKFFKLISILLLLTLALPFMIACGEKDADGDNTGNTPTPPTCNENCTFIATEWFDTAKHFPKKLECSTNSSHVVERTKIEISTPEDFMLLASDLNEHKYIGTTEILIVKDLNLGSKTWNPINLNVTQSSKYNDEELVIDGNGKTIKNLTMNQDFSGSAGLFGSVSGTVGIYVKNLTLDNARIYGDLLDTNGNRAVGAIVGLARGIKKDIIIENCTVKNSIIKGAHWCGGLVGYCCKELTLIESLPKISISITETVMENCEIESIGSAGAYIGHAGGCRNVKVDVFNGAIKDTSITSTGSSTIKAGALIGTIGLAEVVINMDVSLIENVTVISGGEENSTRFIYGRFGNKEDAKYASLTVNGVEMPTHAD